MTLKQAKSDKKKNKKKIAKVKRKQKVGSIEV